MKGFLESAESSQKFQQRSTPFRKFTKNRQDLSDNPRDYPWFRHRMKGFESRYGVSSFLLATSRPFLPRVSAGHFRWTIFPRAQLVGLPCSACCFFFFLFSSFFSFVLPLFFSAFFRSYLCVFFPPSRFVVGVIPGSGFFSRHTSVRAVFGAFAPNDFLCFPSPGTWRFFSRLFLFLALGFFLDKPAVILVFFRCL